MTLVRTLAALALAAAGGLAAGAETAPQRSSWYIGFGLGGGPSPRYVAAGQSRTFDDWFGSVSHGSPLVINFKVGATLNEHSLLGLDITASGQLSERGVTPARQIQISNLLAVYTYFPQRTGLFLRGGAGLANLMMEVGSYETSANGYGALLGVGYAFWLGQTFNLTLNLDHSRQTYSSQIDRSSFTAVYVGFDWY